MLHEIDHGVLVVVEEPKPAIDPDVDAGRLDHRVRKGFENHPSGVDLGTDVTV